MAPAHRPPLLSANRFPACACDTYLFTQYPHVATSREMLVHRNVETRIRPVVLSNRLHRIGNFLRRAISVSRIGTSADVASHSPLLGRASSCTTKSPDFLREGTQCSSKRRQQTAT